MVIRPEQMMAFEQAARRRFEDEMVVHSKDFSPRLCEVIGEEQLRAALRPTIERAEGYGFTNRGPIRLLVEMMFLCGSGFDTDPQYPALGKVLRSAGDQMERAQLIHEGHNDYLERVSGPGAVNVKNALSDLLKLARTPLTVAPGHLVETLLRGMTSTFPQKVAYVGEAGLKTLIDEGIAEAQRYHFEGERPVGLLVILKFAFGHRCTDDPLYPWIARTLQDERTVSPSARAERLEEKAVTWLEHVVARNERASLP